MNQMLNSAWLWTWVQFHKSFNSGIFYWCKNAEKINFGVKNASFLATNIEQHVANLSIFVAQLCILVTHFGIFKANFFLWNWTLKTPSFFGVMLSKFWRYGFFEIEQWKHQNNFGILKYNIFCFGFMKSTPNHAKWLSMHDFFSPC